MEAVVVYIEACVSICIFLSSTLSVSTSIANKRAWSTVPLRITCVQFPGSSCVVLFPLVHPFGQFCLLSFSNFQTERQGANWKSHLWPLLMAIYKISKDDKHKLALKRDQVEAGLYVGCALEGLQEPILEITGSWQMMIPSKWTHPAIWQAFWRISSFHRPLVHQWPVSNW